ncbi:MAG: peptidoglycan DD-metalloendopeptidase family protein [Propionibacteriaceae bacterium]|nr:peptidoglycan DD-metalloendopeptidase family protein [Propionibacteriaceae bacterium]
MKISIAVVMALALALLAPPIAHAEPLVPAGSSLRPLSGPVVRGFDPPDERWGAGHRGVDVAGRVGDAIISPRAGRVSFAGVVAGRPVVTVTHGVQRTTLEPVVAVVPVGAEVAAGQVVGHLQAGHQPCPAEACLHWGLLEGETYLDPVGSGPDAPRLLPESAVAGVRERAAQREAERSRLGDFGPGGPGRLASPTNGRLGSRFGPRFHPIFKEWRMHQGVDISNACGTPLWAAADGVVSHRGYDSSGGWRLVLDHGTIDGVALQTVYLHAEGYRVRNGERVTRGQVVGTMGTTGWSTGCHLHFGVKANGRHVDPLPWLS